MAASDFPSADDGAGPAGARSGAARADATGDARPGRGWRLAGAGLSILIILASAIIVTRTLATTDYAALRAAIAATAYERFGWAALFTAASYLALTGYDALALRQMAMRVRYRITALASFTSYAISFTLGFPLITAGTVRYWVYSREGLRAGHVASLTVIAGLTFWLGMALVLALCLLWRPAAVAELNHLTTSVNALTGAGVLAAVAAYLVWVSQSRRRISVRGLRIDLPGLPLTLGQIALGMIDLCCAAAALYVLLPAGTDVDFTSFVAIYVFACVLGIASHAPGGIGAFEATMLGALPAPSQEALLASLLLFRLVYYVIPCLLAFAMLGYSEGRRRWKAMRAEISGADKGGGAAD